MLKVLDYNIQAPKMQNQNPSLSSSAIKFNNDLAEHMSALVKQMELLEADNVSLRAELEKFKSPRKNNKIVCNIRDKHMYKIFHNCPDAYDESKNIKEYRTSAFMKILSQRFGASGFTAKEAINYITNMDENYLICGENQLLKDFRWDRVNNRDFACWTANKRNNVKAYIKYLVNDGFLSVYT